MYAFQRIETELPDNIEAKTSQAMQLVFDHIALQHTLLQMHQRTVTVELKARGDLAIDRLGQMKQPLQQALTKIIHLHEHISAMCQTVPANFSLHQLVNEVHVTLERTNCSITYDADAQFR